MNDEKMREAMRPMSEDELMRRLEKNAPSMLNKGVFTSPGMRNYLKKEEKQQTKSMVCENPLAWFSRILRKVFGE